MATSTINPWSVGAVVFDQRSWMAFYERQMARQQAKEDALNNYFKDLFVSTATVNLVNLNLNVANTNPLNINANTCISGNLVVKSLEDSWSNGSSGAVQVYGGVGVGGKASSAAITIPEINGEEYVVSTAQIVLVWFGSSSF